jgi:hypothetical protein
LIPGIEVALASDIQVGAVEWKDHDSDLRADVFTLAGVNRGRVEAVIAAGGVFDEDVDDDSIAAAQTLLLVINENYQFDGAAWRRNQARAASAASDEALMYNLSKAVTAGRDTSAVAGSQITTVEARNSDADADYDAALIGLTANSRLAALGAAAYQRLTGRILSGVTNEALFGLITRSAVSGLDTGAVAGSQVTPVEARNSDVDADFDAALIGLVTNSRLSILRATTSAYGRLHGDLASDVSGSAPTGRVGVYANALAVGIDNTAVAALRPVEARNSDSDLDYDAALIGFLTNSRLGVLRAAAGTYSRVHGDLASDVSGATPISRMGIYVNALAVGIDNTAAAALRPVEVRNIDAVGDVAEALVGLLTNSRLSFRDERAGAYDRLDGITANSVDAAQAAGLYVYQPRETAFPATTQGRRFYVTHQTVGTVVTGQTAFLATTPTFLMRQALSIVKIVLRSITLSQVGTVAGGFITFAVVLDTADRFSVGGTAVTPQNVNEESAAASALTSFLFNPTATAAGAGTRVLVQTSAGASLGTVTSIEFKDGVFMGTTSSLLVYAFAATTGPSLYFTFEWEEVTA